MAKWLDWQPYKGCSRDRSNLKTTKTHSIKLQRTVNTYKDLLSISCDHWLKHWTVMRTFQETFFRNESISNSSCTFFKSPPLAYGWSNALPTTWFLFSLPISCISCNENIAGDYLSNFHLIYPTTFWIHIHKIKNITCACICWPFSTTFSLAQPFGSIETT